MGHGPTRFNTGSPRSNTGSRGKARRCSHGRGLTLCFECFQDGSERTRARQEAWAQRSLPFEQDAAAERKLTPAEIAHRRRMLAYLEASARRRA